MQKIKHIFFDLDRTIWDFEKNSHDTLVELWVELKLANLGVSLVEEFIKIYKEINEECWGKYRRGELSQQELRHSRFARTFGYYGIEDNELAAEIGREYIKRCPIKTGLIDGAEELLDDLSLDYQLHVITNGFDEVQRIKIKACGLDSVFGHIITSDNAGVKKPDPRIFKAACEAVGESPENVIYVGDDYVVDVKGAADVGLLPIYFNPHRSGQNVGQFPETTSLYEIVAIVKEIDK